MPKQLRGALLRVGVPISVAALVAVAASSFAATGKMQPTLHIRPGLWEFSSTEKLAGDTVFRDALLEGIPPAQRAQHLALLRQEVQRPSKARECLSQALFERQSSLLGTGCKQTIVSNTATKFEVLTQCQATDHAWKDVSSSRTVMTPTTSVTSGHGVSSEGGKAMTRDTVQSGHWISSSCGTVHGFQVL